MAQNRDDPNTLVFEYHGQNESTETAFSRLFSTVTEKSPQITGFRLELTTAGSFDVPIDALVGQQAASEETKHNQTNTATTSSTDRSDSNEAGDTIPSLQSDALPAKVLSNMLDCDADQIRTSELQEQFESDKIDTARVSQTLASLKRRGLVAAKPDPEDKRANIYWPTEQGQQALNN